MLNYCLITNIFGKNKLDKNKLKNYIYIYIYIYLVFIELIFILKY